MCTLFVLTANKLTMQLPYLTHTTAKSHFTFDVPIATLTSDVVGVNPSSRYRYFYAVHEMTIRQAESSEPLTLIWLH